MNCQRFEDLITDYLDQQLPDGDAAAFQEHIAQCASCAELLQHVSDVVRLCRSFPEAEPPITLPERILSATLGEKRRLSWRELLNFAAVGRLFSPRLVLGTALVICFFALLSRVLLPDQRGEGLTMQAVLMRVDQMTQSLYTNGAKLYYAKNRAVAELDYWKTTVFNQIDYHLSQISGPEKTAPAKSPPAATKESEKGRKAS